MSETVKCVNCDEIISIRNRKCPHCGASQNKKKSKGRRGRIIVAVLIIILVVSACITIYLLIPEDIGKFGTDYWFETVPGGEEVLITADGWTFELNVREAYRLDGIILGTKYYYMHDSPYSPINTFSHIDILVGIDDVAENLSKYDYEITSWGNREVTWYMYYDDYSDYEYFSTHTGNNHLIAHNSVVYNKLFELEKGDRFILSGYIVEPYGTRDNHYVTWPSDNQIGNYACEVILVDTLDIF